METVAENTDDADIPIPNMGYEAANKKLEQGISPNAGLYSVLLSILVVIFCILGGIWGYRAFGGFIGGICLGLVVGLFCGIFSTLNTRLLKLPNPTTTDDGDFVAPYLELIDDTDTYEVLLDFTLDQVIDHGSFYEITNQVLNYAIGDGYGGTIRTPIYEGGVYVSKKAMSNRTLTKIEQEIEAEKTASNGDIHYKWILGSYLENPMTPQGFFNYFDMQWPSF